MHRSSMTTKIWLSVGIFILGYVLSTTLGQVRDSQARKSLRVASDALFPAAQRSQGAESAFQRMVKGFADAVVMQDLSGLDRAVESGKQAATDLRSQPQSKACRLSAAQRPHNSPMSLTNCWPKPGAPMERC